MTELEAAAIVGKLMLAYPREGNPDVIELYVEHLADLDRDRTMAAVGRLTRTSRWLPTIAEVRETVRAMTPIPRPIELAPPSARLPLGVDPATAEREREAARGRVKAMVDDLMAKFSAAKTGGNVDV